MWCVINPSIRNKVFACYERPRLWNTQWQFHSVVKNPPYAGAEVAYSIKPEKLPDGTPSERGWNPSLGLRCLPAILGKCGKTRDRGDPLPRSH